MLLLKCLKFALTISIIHLILEVDGSEYSVWITHNGPIVRGGSITFQAELFRSDGSRPEGKFRFSWIDDTIPFKRYVDVTHEPRSTWNVSFPASTTYPGEYLVQVNIDKEVLLFWDPICSRRTTFNVTALLNGRMDLVQSGNSIKSNYVSNTTQVMHEIVLSKPDYDFIMNATEVATYWFIDCIFYGQTENFSFNYTYGTVGANHSIEALVVASFEPLTTPAPSTTTTSTTTTTTTTTPSTTTSTTTSTPKTTTAVASVPLIKVNDNSKAFVNSSEGGPTRNATIPMNLPYVCLNSSIVPPDPKKTYGYFHHQIGVKSPVDNITMKGTNWLQGYELLDLQISCTGTGLFRTCYYAEDANYNVTGKETCQQEQITESCAVNVTRYSSSENYTMIVIISNDVSKKVYPVKVILYKVQKHEQLSVIVVPVVCSLVAVIMIVFGVAYYVQRRKRFTVEVADFDFGQGVGDMEYKTFRERLREAVVNSLNRDFGVDGEGNVWSPSRKYGSMH